MRRWFRVGAAWLAACVLTACAALPESSAPEPSAGEDSPFPVTAAGVTLKASPERIVVLAPVLADTVSELSAGSRLCGVSTACLSAVSDGVTDLGDQYALNTDRLTALRPDLVLALTMTPELTDWQTAQGVPVAVLDAPADLSGLRRLTADVAALLFGGGSDEKAAAVCDAVEDGLAALSAKIPLPETPRRAVYLPDDTGAAATGDTLWQPVFDSLRLSNIAADGTGWTLPENAKQPDIVIVPEALKAAAKQQYPSAEIVTVSEEAALRGGMALVQTAQYLAQALYPEVFPADLSELSEDMSETGSADG